jgi:hypothetical protein
MTIKQFWNRVNCWGAKPIRKVEDMQKIVDENL